MDTSGLGRAIGGRVMIPTTSTDLSIVHELPGEIATLVEACSRDARASERPLDRLRGVALYDTQKDDFVRNRPEFGAATNVVRNIPKFAERMGGDATAARVTVQLVFNHFARLTDITDKGDAARVWSDLIDEVANPNWTYFGVSNLHHFRSEVGEVDLGDGLSIRGRRFEELRAIGFSEFALDQMTDDWRSGFGPSEFVLLAKDDVPKEPDNLVNAGGLSAATNAQRAIGALRLIAHGDVRIGPIWLCRPDGIGLVGGTARTGASIPAFGEDFIWKQSFGAAYKSAYRNLKMLEVKGYRACPGNLNIALRSFMSTYDRWPTLREQQLIDAVTALEALFGTNNEISFRLAFRIAGLLADDGKERAQLFATVSEFYKTRSQIVHGSSPKGAHAERLQRFEELRNILRRVLRLLVPYAASPPATLPKAAFNDGVFEQALLDDIARERMRDVLRSLAVPEALP